MKFFITSDANWDARLSKLVYTLSDNSVEDYFYLKSYGTSMDALSIILMCRDPELNFKQRIKFSKKEKKLSTDIMLDFNLFKVIEQSEKEKIVANKLLTELPLIISNYKFKDFDLLRFESDLEKLLKKIKWI